MNRDWDMIGDGGTEGIYKGDALIGGTGVVIDGIPPYIDDQDFGV